MVHFFIKKTYANTEERYWQGQALKEFPLTRERAVTEFFALGFYRLLGVPTPKMYLGEAGEHAVFISKLMKNWHSKRYEQTFQEPIPSLSAELQALPEFELASAVLADTDPTGWFLDNIGTKDRHDGLEHLTKHDGGTATEGEERREFFKHFFKDELDRFPEGNATLTNDLSLNTTYLKVFKEKSVCPINDGIFLFLMK